MLARNGAGEGVPVVSQDLVAFREYEYREVCEATRNFAATEMLGSGKFADVYRGTTPDGVKHAFKRLKERAEEGSRAGELLERELRTLCRLSHPSVVRLHGSCITPSEQVLVYEIVEGGTLEDAIKTQKGLPLALQADDEAQSLCSVPLCVVLPWGGQGKDRQGCQLHLKQRLAIAQGIAEALGYLHSQGVIHRDIKPANILLSAALEPKVADFGLLKCLDPDHSDTLTRLAGTPGYMDPETMRTSRVSFQSDVYSFGIILLTLLTGRGPAVLDQRDIAFAKQCEESVEAGEALPEYLAELQLARRQGRSKAGPKKHSVAFMGLRRWVSALSRAGQMQAILDPFLWPLWEQISGATAGTPGAPGAPGSVRRQLRAGTMAREERRKRMLTKRAGAGAGEGSKAGAAGGGRATAGAGGGAGAGEGGGAGTEGGPGTRPSGQGGGEGGGEARGEREQPRVGSPKGSLVSSSEAGDKTQAQSQAQGGSPEEAREERHRKTLRLIKALVALALHCSAEDPTSRPPAMATVAEDLHMMMRSVPPLLKPGRSFQELALPDIAELVPGGFQPANVPPTPADSRGGEGFGASVDAPTSANAAPTGANAASLRLSEHPRAGEIFYGKSQWDGEPFLVQRIGLRPTTPGTPLAWRSVGLPASSAKEEAVPEGEEGQGGSEKHVWDQERSKSGKESAIIGSESASPNVSEEEAVVERARAGAELRHGLLLPVVACCRSPGTDEAFVLYGLPHASQGYEVLECVLLGAGTELLPVLAPDKKLWDFQGLGLSNSGSQDSHGATRSGAPPVAKSHGRSLSISTSQEGGGGGGGGGGAREGTPGMQTLPASGGRKLFGSMGGNHDSAGAGHRRRVFGRAGGAGAEHTAAKQGAPPVVGLPVDAGGSGPVDFTPPPKMGQAIPLSVRCRLALQVAQALEFLRRSGTPCGAVALGNALVHRTGTVSLVGYAWPPPGAPHEGEQGPGQAQGPGEGQREGEGEGQRQGRAAGGLEDVAGFGEFLLELVLERGPQVTAAMDLFAVERAARHEGMPLSDWVELLIDKGRVVSMAADIYPDLKVREDRATRGAQGGWHGKDGSKHKGGGPSAVGPQGHALESLLILGLQCVRPAVLGEAPYAEIISRLQAIKDGITSGAHEGPSGAPDAHRPALQRPALQRQAAKRR